MPAGVGIGEPGNLARHNVPVVVEERFQRGTFAADLLLAAIGALRFCHDREASTAGISVVRGCSGSPRRTVSDP